MINEIVLKIKIKGKECDSKFYLKSLLDFLKKSNQFLKIEDYEFVNKENVIISQNNKKLKDKGD